MDLILILVLLLFAFRLGQCYERKDKELESPLSAATPTVTATREQPITALVVDSPAELDAFKVYAIDEEDPERRAYVKLEIYATAGDYFGFLDEFKEDLSASFPEGKTLIETGTVRMQDVNEKLDSWKLACRKHQRRKA